MANKNNIPVKSDDTTTTGGSTTSAKTTMHILGYSDTQIDQGVFDPTGKEILTKISLSKMGNKERQARKGKERVVYNKFGRESTKEAVKEHQKNSEKAPQLTLGNVLGLSNMPKPGPGAGGPRPR